MLDKLGNGIKSALEKISKGIFVDEKIVNSLILDLQKSLLEADVDVELTRKFTEKIKKRSLKEKLPPGLSRSEHIVKLVYDELINLLGKEQKSYKIDKTPFIILLIGLFGSGKTTSAGKLGKFFQNIGYKVGLVCCDSYRAAAFQQLSQIGKSINVQVFGDESIKDPLKLASIGIKKFKDFDIVIIDTAGRHKKSKDLLFEMKEMTNTIDPDETMLVIDGGIGQAAKEQIVAFHDVAPIGSILISKLDGTSRGGGVLVTVASTDAKIMFIGTGEKSKDLEEYDPIKFVSRLIGYGDLRGLIKKVEDSIEPGKVKEIMKGKFTFRDFCEQIKSVQKMGSLSQMSKMLPFGSKIPNDLLSVQQEKMKKWMFMIDSMTKSEIDDPDILDSSRINRISLGSGTEENELRELLRHYRHTRKLMKMTKGGKGMNRGMIGKLMKQLGIKGM